MKRVEITETIPYEFRVAKMPYSDTLEVTIGRETYRIIDQRLGIAVNLRTGEHVTLEMEDERILSLAS